ncbi:unnamed protein product [Hydatigera taeniaeformis]|uniref:CLEC16A_C domain-containing protein n=1 Tax=Hydatigena taeniaeformis TaxID=6205 RepID=A0A0R3WYR4_HYDTA|nr:unnamed protein product [Hydatigera taeniaeformis]
MIGKVFCALTFRLANRGRIEDLVAETGDHLHYIDDIFALGIPDLTNVLILVLLQRLLLPVYVSSLTKRPPSSCFKSQKRGSSKASCIVITVLSTRSLLFVFFPCFFEPLDLV